MFHYSLAKATNRSRLLFAALIAITLHLSLMNIEFASRPVRSPVVSLPRSISVSLSRRGMVAPSVPREQAQTVRDLKEIQQKTTIKPEELILKNKTSINEIKDHPVQVPVQPGSMVQQPEAERIISAPVSTEQTIKDLLPDSGQDAKIREPALQTKPQTAPEEDGTGQPGTVQTAYPRYQLNTPPAYPRLARKRGMEGTVTLQVLVNREGRVDDLKIETSSGFGLLDRAAVAAVKDWSFEPGRKNRDPIEMWVRVPVVFKLK